MINGDGSFQTQPIQPGTYELNVVTSSGVVLYSQIVHISTPRIPVTIDLPDSSQPRRPEGSTVSLRQLSHTPPAQAKKAFEKGVQAESKGNREQAAEFFQQAVSIDPQYADAFNELGAAQAFQSQLPQAVESFQNALKADPEHPLANANLSIALAKSARYEEAAVAARRALQFLPGSATVRYILASSLLFSHGETDEALDNLERSASEIPFAHLLAGEILAHRGKRAEAAQHFEEYLKVVPADDKHRSRAEAMLARLRSQSDASKQ